MNLPNFQIYTVSHYGLKSCHTNLDGNLRKNNIFSLTLVSLKGEKNVYEFSKVPFLDKWKKIIIFFSGLLVN